MEKVIITDKALDIQFPPESVRIINAKDFTNDIPSTWELYTNEYIPFKICESFEGSGLMIGIDFSISQPIDKYIIAHHFISSKKGIVFFFSENEQEPLQLESDMGLFRNKAIKLINNEKLIEIITNDQEAEKYALIYNDDFDFSNYKENYERFIIIDRHQITNEWGATKLLLNHGLSLTEIEAEFVLPKTIYFKNKLIEHSIDKDYTVRISGYPKEAELNSAKTLLVHYEPQIRNVLLIDDNANKGWEFALRKIFKSAGIDTKFSFSDCEAISDFSSYDLIFLDLRLPSNNSDDKIPKISNGYSLIEKIKNNANSLHVPLIVFTASQKARTLHDIIEIGADAMYVKESTDLNPNESLDNYLDFIREINNQIEKGLQLKRYWSAIKRIKNEFLPEVTNTGALILKDRIIERLEMFYGLIKKKHEQSSYNDTQFHFSSDVLSFITLWSILNEIQECYFEKGIGQAYTKIKDFTTTPPSFININLDNWKVRNQLPEKYFLVEKPIIEEDINMGGGRARPHKDHIKKDIFSNFQYSKNPPFFEFDTNGFKYRKNYKERLSLQIAFLILAKTQLNSSSKINDYLKILKEANEQRNKLYITHGEDVDTTFHNQLEKDKPMPPNLTFELFGLITYLLTGCDSIV